jgi:hypothetical protein
MSASDVTHLVPQLMMTACVVDDGKSARRSIVSKTEAFGGASQRHDGF